MKPGQLVCTMAAILVFGLPPLAGAQPGPKDHGNGTDETAVKAEQKGQPQQARQQTQRRAPAMSVRRAQAPVAPVARRHALALVRPPQTMFGRAPTAIPTRNPQQRDAVSGRNRLTPPSRQVVPAPVASRPSEPRVEQRAIWPRYRAQSWGAQHRTWMQRGGYRGYRIPTERFSLYFGRPHRYHLSNFDVRIVAAYPQFYANGFRFNILDPVPEYWDHEWYDMDYVTIIQTEDGYYLRNEAYPEDALAISVQF